MRKRLSAVMACVAALSLFSCSNNNQNNTDMETKAPVFGLGSPVDNPNFSGEAWLNMLSAVPENDCNIYNVTFAPGVRNSWHSHAVGQILLCTEGVGYYQEQGKTARRLMPGDVVDIPAGVMHWHGAAPDSQFTHVGVTPRASENPPTWGAPVTDEEYRVATGQ